MLGKRELIRIVILLEPSSSLPGYESKYIPLLRKYMDTDDYEITIIGNKIGMASFLKQGIKYRTISLGPKSSSGISLVIGYVIYMGMALIALLQETKYSNAHILMSLGGHTYSGLLVTLVSMLLQRKSIVRFAGPTRKTIRIRYKLGFIYSAIAKIIENWVFSRCDIVVSNSPITHYIDTGKYRNVVISQGVNTEEFRPLPVETHPDEFPRLLTVARLSKEKRISNIIFSLAKLSMIYQNVHLDIVGNGPERKNLESICYKLGLQQRIKFHGYVKPSMLPSIISASDVFILPSATESLPSAMLEAMACKIPVIVAKDWIDNLPDFESGKNVLTCDGNPESIVKSVIFMLNNEHLRKKIIKNAFQTIQQHHTHTAARSIFRKIVVELMTGKIGE